MLSFNKITQLFDCANGAGSLAAFQNPMSQPAAIVAELALSSAAAFTF